MTSSTRRGFTITDATALVVCVALAAGFGLPALRTIDCDEKKAVSTDHLVELGLAHALYAADWNDRQFTVVRDDLGAFGGDCRAYAAANGPHPPLILGDDCEGVTRGFYFDDEQGCADFDVVRPMAFDGPAAGFGSFRAPNARGFHEYVGGRFFDPVFFAPKDAIVLDVVEPLLDVPCEFVGDDTSLVGASSYVLSPAAMYHPSVLGRLADGGFRSPDGFAEGYESPSVSQAKYPALKTRMLEHHWLQVPVAPCNPAVEGGTVGPFACEPYYFNQAFRSRPMTLFYDGHVRGLSTQEAVRSDRRVSQGTPGERLWSRGTPLGQDGYFSDLAYDIAPDTSFHILTTEGIRGRDTIFGP